MDWSLLRSLSAEDAKRVLAMGHPRRFARREVVWHEGDRADTVHMISSGRIAVRATTSMGEVVTIFALGPGDAAGLVAVTASEPYHTTASVALEATEALAIRVDDLTDVRRRHRAFDDALLQYVADRTLDLARQLAEALYVPADTRVLRRLILLSGLYDRGEVEVVIPLTQDDLAELAGVSRPTVNRVLKSQERLGTITLLRRSITVIDRETLILRAR